MQLASTSNNQLLTQKQQRLEQTEEQSRRQSLHLQQQLHLDLHQKLPGQRERNVTSHVSHAVCGPNQNENHDDRQNRLLHLALCCANPNPDLIRNILRFDPEASSRRHNIYTLSSVWCPISKKVIERRRREPYSYAINLALYKKVNTKIIIMLIESAPHVMLLSDGTRKEHSLSILLRSHPDDIPMVDLLLLGNPNAAKVCDKFNNSPLHVACTSGSSLPMIKHIFAFAMDSAFNVNMHGDTPYDIAVKNYYRCSQEVVEYLKSKII
jgi:Ankyrin repeats (3 copies)